jgi:DNA polymerase-4
VEALRAQFGSSAEWYHAIARGRDERPVSPDRVRKSSGSETTFDRDLLAGADIEAGVLGQADEVWAWCARAQSFGRTVTVKIKFADFRIITRSQTRPRAFDTADALRAAALALVRGVLPVAQGVRLVGVTVSKFGEEQGGLPLFAGGDG